jgi:hypothetical protein
MKHLWYGIILGALVTFAWAEKSHGAELYRCPGNLYTDKPGPKCKPVAERLSIIQSAHAQHEAHLEKIAAARREERAVAPPTVPPVPAAPLDASDE